MWPKNPQSKSMCSKWDENPQNALKPVKVGLLKAPPLKEPPSSCPENHSNQNRKSPVPGMTHQIEAQDWIAVGRRVGTLAVQHLGSYF